MAYDISTLIDNLQSTASSYGSSISNLAQTFLDWAASTTKPAERGPFDPSLTYLDSSEVTPLREKYETPAVDTTTAAQDVSNTIQPFITDLTDAPANLKTLETNLLSQLNKITTDLSSITASQADFDPAVIIDNFGTNRANFMVEAQNWFKTYLDAYSPVSLTQLASISSILGDMLNGLGLPTEILTTIWDQTRDQVSTEAATMESQAYADFAARGFSAPAGALAAQIQQIRYQKFAKTAGASRDIAIKQAEIIINNQKFAVQTGLNAYNQFVAQVFRVVEIYTMVFMEVYSQLSTLPIRSKVEYLLGMNRELFQGDDTYLQAERLIPEIAQQGGRLAALPFNVQAQLSESNTRFAAVEAEFARIYSDYSKTNLATKLRSELSKADWTTRMDLSDLEGYYRFKSGGESAASNALWGYSRISATALSGLNAIASSTQINF